MNNSDLISRAYEIILPPGCQEAEKLLNDLADALGDAEDKIEKAYMVGWEDGFLGGSDDPNVNDPSAEEDFQAWQNGTRIE